MTYGNVDNLFDSSLSFEDFSAMECPDNGIATKSFGFEKVDHDGELEDFLNEVFVEQSEDFPLVDNVCNSPRSDPSDYSPQLTPVGSFSTDLPLIPELPQPPVPQYHHEDIQMEPMFQSFQQPQHHEQPAPVTVHQPVPVSVDNLYVPLPPMEDNSSTLGYSNVTSPISPTSRSSSSADDDEEDDKSVGGRKIFYRRSWTPEEDRILISLVEKHGAQHWSKLAAFIPNKTGNQCSQRWCKALDPNIKKGKWSKEEDDSLRRAVSEMGTKWKAISKRIPGRTGKQCRDRYTARLNPQLKTSKWTAQEEAIALQAYRAYGNRWATIQKLLPQRSWYTIKWKIESLTKDERN